MPPRVPVYNQETNQLAPLRVARMDTGLKTSGLEYLGEGINDANRIFRQLQEAADTAESGRLARETAAEFQKVVKEAALKYADPLEFEQEAENQLQEVKQRRLESASSGRVRANLSNHIGEDLILRRVDIQVNKHGKLKASAIGNWTKLKLDSVQDYSISDDPLEKQRIVENLGTTLRDLAASNLIDADDKAREMKVITEQIAEVDIRNDFKKDPIGALERMDKDYSKRLSPEKLHEIKSNLAVEYRVAQAEIKRKVSDEQNNNFADAMVAARKPGGLTQQMIDEMSLPGPDGSRKIDAQQAITLTQQLKATNESGGTLYSNPNVLSDLQFRLHRGRIDEQEIRSHQLNGNLTISDANQLYNGLESRRTRDRVEHREAERDRRDAARDKRDIARDLRQEQSDRMQSIRDARYLDISNDLNYKRGEEYIKRALPNADRLDLDHAFRIMVGQAFMDFDDAARAVDSEGKPKYKPEQLQKVAENIVDGTLQKMDLQQNAARARLRPGIRTPEDVAAARKAGRLSDEEAREQMRYLLMLGAQATPPAAPATNAAVPATADRNQAARDRAKQQGAR